MVIDLCTTALVQTATAALHVRCAHNGFVCLENCM